MPKNITSHDVLEPLKQVLSASRDVIISGQICGSKLQRVFTLGDGCWLPTKDDMPGIGGDDVELGLGLQRHAYKLGCKEKGKMNSTIKAEISITILDG